MRIAYPGSAGSYTEEAATRLYPDAERIALGDFEEVARAAASGEVDRAVLPIENSLAGLVPDTLTIIERGELSIVAEAVLHIPHCLVGIPGATLEGRPHGAQPPDGARAVPDRPGRVRASRSGDDLRCGPARLAARRPDRGRGRESAGGRAERARRAAAGDLRPPREPDAVRRAGALPAPRPLRARTRGAPRSA